MASIWKEVIMFQEIISSIVNAEFYELTNPLIEMIYF